MSHPPTQPPQQPYGGQPYGSQPYGGQPPMGQGYGQPYGQPQPQGPSKGRKAGKVLLIIGAIIAVLAIIAGVLGGGGVSRGVTNITDNRIELTGQRTIIELKQGDERMVWRREGSPSLSCTVTGEDGNTLTVSDQAALNVTLGSDRYLGVVSFTADKDGRYLVGCRATGGSGQQPDGFIGNALDAGSLVGGVFGVLGAVLGGLLAAVLLLIGLILFLTGRK